MKVVGVGCGPGMLTEEAIRVITAAEVIYGSDRAIEIARTYIPSGCSVRTIDDFKNLSRLPEDAVVLSTGDPMLAGLGYLPGEVVPGISSLQLAGARLHLPLSRIAIVVAHGKGHEKGTQETLDFVRQGRIVFLIADPAYNVAELYRRLGQLGCTVRVAVCENLGYPAERITVRDLPEAIIPGAPLYALVIGTF